MKFIFKYHESNGCFLVLFITSTHSQAHCLTRDRHSHICEKKEGKEKEREEGYKVDSSCLSFFFVQQSEIGVEHLK